MSLVPLSNRGHSKCRITLRDAFHVVAVKSRRKVCDGAPNVKCMHLSPKRYSEALNAIRRAVRTATAMEEPHGPYVIKDDGGCPQTFVLGLTGSIGMGKSTVSAMFREEGVPVWDADAAVHELYSRNGAAVPLVGVTFPGVIVDGAIDRAALSTHVVGNESAMKQLEAIVHPLVVQSRRQFLEQVQQRGEPLAVLDIPLLFETARGDSSRGDTAGAGDGEEADTSPGLTRSRRTRPQDTDMVAVVSAPPEVQRARVLARPGMNEAKLQAILRRQLSDDDKRRLADHIIDTSTDLESTRMRVSELVRLLRPTKGQ